MQKFKSVEDLINQLKPEKPVYCIRKNSIQSAVKYFIKNFPGKIINCYSVIPNQTGQSDIVVHPYNSVLSMRWLYYYADCVTLFENESLGKILQNENTTSHINYNNLNLIGAKIISTCMHIT